jgi:hypothetical protein
VKLTQEREIVGIDTSTYTHTLPTYHMEEGVLGEWGACHRHWEAVTRSSRTWSSVVVRRETCPFPSDSCLAGAIHTKRKWSNGQQRRVAAGAWRRRAVRGRNQNPSEGSVVRKEGSATLPVEWLYYRESIDSVGRVNKRLAFLDISKS